MNNIQRVACMLLLVLTTLQLNPEVRFTGANARQDERRFRRALALISHADPGNRVLAIEEMEELVHFEFAQDYDVFGSYELFPDVVEIPSWANPEFTYLQEKYTRNMLITRALEACFGDIGITPEEIDEIFNETLARINAYRESQGLSTIEQIERSYHEYALNANDSQWLEERNLSQVIIASPYLEANGTLTEILQGEECETRY